MDEYRLWRQLNALQKSYLLILVNLYRKGTRMVIASFLAAILVYFLLTPGRHALPVAVLAGYYAALGAMVL